MFGCNGETVHVYGLHGITVLRQRITGLYSPENPHYGFQARLCCFGQAPVRSSTRHPLLLLISECGVWSFFFLSMQVSGGASSVHSVQRLGTVSTEKRVCSVGVVIFVANRAWSPLPRKAQ